MIDNDDLFTLFSLSCCISGNCDHCKHVDFGDPEELACQLELRKDINEMMDKYMLHSKEKKNG